MSTLALRRPKDLDLRKPLLRAIATTEGVGPFFARIALGGLMLPPPCRKRSAGSADTASTERSAS